MGDPNLLLYYDTKDQWPSVYKTQKTCLEKEEVIHIEQNQIINLTATLPNYKTLAGCYYMNEKPLEKNKKTNEKNTKPTGKTYSVTLPTLPPKNHRKKTNTAKVITTTETLFTTEGTTEESDIFSPSFDEFTSPSRSHSWPTEETSEFYTEDPNSQYEIFNHTATMKGIHVKYKILMTNGPPGDYWHEHLSADEFYILPILTAFSIGYTILLLGIIVCAIELKSRQLLHTTYRIFFFSVVLQLFGIMIQTIAYLKYAMTGLDTIKVKRTGSIFMGASETSFLLLLLLLAKGYTITRGRLPVACSIKLTIFMCTYVVTYIAIFIYESVVFDPGEVLYLFESPAGYALIILRIIAWCMFVYSTVFTLKHYPEKGNFYYPFNICGTLWFVAGPAFILSGNTYIDKWVRESIVCGVLLLVAFGGHLSFLILTMPSVANKNFPYHVRTTQIGVMEVNNHNGSSAIESFVHHPYEPTTTITEQTVIVPLTRRTEEIFEGMYNQRTYSGLKRAQENQEVVLQGENMMENVLNWSLAKNLKEVEYPQFVSSKRESIASTNSRLSDGVTSSASRRPSEANQNGVPRGYSDYIQDVPVELFTISRMVLSTNNSIAKQNTDEESGKI
ncbi:hypothetical protein HHI36_021754 [Cryptolaemus montrouzieri]|uniref:Intimal thickness related receptor IRP domain-containing protein n=1 Tax=Cryptolaemus montrouzieri TaxID=559131 RepID=A0ABD2MXP8_9CUCU